MLEKYVTLKTGLYPGHFTGEVKSSVGPVPFELVDESKLPGCKNPYYFVGIAGPASVVTKIPTMVMYSVEDFLSENLEGLIAMSKAL